MSKVNTCTLDHKHAKKFQHYIRHWCLPLHQKQSNQPCFKSLVFFFNNILPILHLFNMFVIILFCLCPHGLLRVWNFNSFFQKCSFVQYYISFCYSFLFTPLHLHCPLLCFCHLLHLVACCTSTCTSVDNYFFASTIFSSLMSFIVCASTKCCSTTTSSSDS